MPEDRTIVLDERDFNRLDKIEKTLVKVRAVWDDTIRIILPDYLNDVELTKKVDIVSFHPDRKEVIVRIS